VRNLTKRELEDGLAEISRSPQDDGVLDLIVRRPQTEHRETLQEGMLDIDKGLFGDNWYIRGSKSTADGKADQNMQLTIMNSRVIALVAQDTTRWPLAGDQLYIDMDLSTENLPPGSRLSIGSAVVEVTAVPHTGCKKFVARFGLEATKFVNSGPGKQLNLLGINARVVQTGRIRAQDIIEKVPAVPKADS
jgi:hypothetical protein